MEHKHGVHDSDARFSINAQSRQIKSDPKQKTVIMQNDHNSERFTFELPRYIEQHDVSLCNQIEVHYLNSEAKDKNSFRKGMYTVEDLQVSPEDSEKVVCSWLISQNATQLVGKLSFRLRFKCVENGVITYAWHTAIFADISISDGINADESFEMDYVDIIEQWKEALQIEFAKWHKETVAEMSEEVTAWKEVESGKVRGEMTAFSAQWNDALNVERKRIDNLAKLPDGSTAGDAELADIRVGADGQIHPSAGEAVRFQINNVFERTNTISIGDLNQVIESDRYVVASDTVTNFPADITAQTKTFMLDVQRYNGRWLTQVIHQLYNSVMYFRTGSVVNYHTHDKNFQGGLETSWSEWVRVDNEKYDEVDAENQIIKYQTIDQSGVDLNTFNKRGNFTVAVTNSVNRPSINGGFILRVEENGSFVIQTVYGISGSYPRFWRIGKQATPVAWGEWFKVATSEDIGDLSAQIAELSTEVDDMKNEMSVAENHYYKIANMGDSIVGNVQDSTSVSGFLSKATGATTYNFGFGGCRMSKHSGAWNSFSMYKLADAIASGDFSEQETSALSANVPTYFTDTVNTMKNLDFASVDIMTIAYGTNDFTSAKGLDNNDNLYDTDYFGGALRYSIERIGNAFPNIRFVIVAPCWRFWYDDDGNYLENSDEREMNGVNLHDFVEKCVEIGKEYHLPVVNPYDEMAINRFNRLWWFNENDGTHPNENGRKSIAKLMANTIRGM